MDAINWHSFFFLLVGLAACVFAVAVVASANIVRMACYLVASLAAVAGLFFLAGAPLLGSIQLLVYVGGTMVLLVFGVMLTVQTRPSSLRTGSGQWVIAAVIGGCLVAVLLQAALSVDVFRSADPQAASAPQPTTAQLGLGLVGVRTDQLNAPAQEAPQGMSGYLLPFEIVSVHLLAVLVGAAFLARSYYRAEGNRRAAAPAEDQPTSATHDTPDPS